MEVERAECEHVVSSQSSDRRETVVLSEFVKLKRALIFVKWRNMTNKDWLLV